MLGDNEWVLLKTGPNLTLWRIESHNLEFQFILQIDR